MNAELWLQWWEKGARDYKLGFYRPPTLESLREVYEEGNTVAQKAWVAEKRGKLDD